MYIPRDLADYTSLVPWLEYINNILTKDLVQVSPPSSFLLPPVVFRQVEDTERVILDEPGYLRNLTVLLPKVTS